MSECEVECIDLDFEQGFQLDLERLAAAIRRLDRAYPSRPRIRARPSPAADSGVGAL